MKKPGLLGTLLLVMAPAAIIMVASSRYPTMIERRIEQRKKDREVTVQPSAKVVTLEIISPDGQARPELEQAARGTVQD